MSPSPQFNSLFRGLKLAKCSGLVKTNYPQLPLLSMIYSLLAYKCYLVVRFVSGFKETAFMYSVSSAGLVHSFARACSRGQLDRCSCDDSFHPSKNKETWRWGGCGDNIQFARKFTKKFLRSQKSQDLRALVDKHNTNVGVMVSC